MKRRATRQIQVGTVPIGGDAPIAVQSMTTTYTRDVQALRSIKRQIHLPLIVDIHYNGKLALLAIEQEVDAVRINPGNLLGGREMFTRIVSAARAAGIAMRIGVNSGSIDAFERGPQMRKVSMKMRDNGTLVRTDPAEERRREREQLVERMVARALEYCGWAEDLGFP